MKNLICTVLIAFQFSSPLFAEGWKRKSSSPNTSYQNNGWSAARRGRFQLDARDGNKTLLIPKAEHDRMMVDDHIYHSIQKSGELAPGIIIAARLMAETKLAFDDNALARRTGAEMIQNYKQSMKENRHLNQSSYGLGGSALNNLTEIGLTTLRTTLKSVKGKLKETPVDAAYEIVRAAIGQNDYDLEKENEHLGDVRLAAQRYRDFADGKFDETMDMVRSLCATDPKFRESFNQTFQEWVKVDPLLSVDENKALDPSFREQMTLRKAEAEFDANGNARVTLENVEKMMKNLAKSARETKLNDLSESERANTLRGLQVSLRTAGTLVALLEDAETAQKVQTVGQGLIEGYTAMSAYKMSMARANSLLNASQKMSDATEKAVALREASNLKLSAGIDLLSGLTNVAGLLFSLFNSGPTVEELILQEVRDLRDEVASMRGEFRESFKDIDRRFDDLFGLVSDGFEMISGQIGEVKAQVSDVQVHVAQLQTQVLQLDNALAEYAYDMTQLLKVETVETCLAADHLITLSEYRKCLSQFKVLAESYSTSAAIAGVPETVLNNRSLETWKQTGFFSDLSQRIDRAGAVNSSRSIRLVLESAANRYGLENRTIANPADWASTVLAMELFISRHPDLVVQDPGFVLETLGAARRVGESTQSAIHRLTVQAKVSGEQALSPLRLALLDYSHALDELERSVSDERAHWEAKHLGGHSLNASEEHKKTRSEPLFPRTIAVCPESIRAGVNYPKFDLPDSVLNSMVPNDVRVAVEMGAVKLSLCYSEADWADTDARFGLSDGENSLDQWNWGKLGWTFSVYATDNSGDNKATLVASRRYVSEVRYKYAVCVWRKYHHTVIARSNDDLQKKAKELSDSKRAKGFAISKHRNGDNYSVWLYGGEFQNRDGVAGQPDWCNGDAWPPAGSSSWIEHALKEAWNKFNEQPLNSERFAALMAGSLNEEQQRNASDWLKTKVEGRRDVVRRAYDNEVLRKGADHESGVGAALRALDGAQHFSTTLISLALPNSARTNSELHRHLHGDKQLLDRSMIVTELGSPTEAVSEPTLDKSRASVLAPARQNLKTLQELIAKLEGLPRKNEEVTKIQAGLESLARSQAKAADAANRIPLDEAIQKIRSQMALLK